MKYRGIKYGIDNGYYRILNSKYDPDCPFEDIPRFIGPYFKSRINLRKYIDVLIVKYGITSPKGL